jgi:hypothetical protein
MNLMAGWDVIIEVSRPTLERLIRTNVRIGEKRLKPPFELQFPVGGVASGTVTLIVTEVLLRLSGSRGAELSLVFSGSSAELDTPARQLSLLQGHAQVKGNFALLDSPDGRHRLLALDLSRCTADVRFSEQSERRIAAAFAKTPLKSHGFRRLLNTQLAAFVRPQGCQAVSEADLRVLPEAIDAVSQTRLPPLEIHNLANTSVTVRGQLTRRKNTRNNQKITSAIQPGHDLAVSISAAVFAQGGNGWEDKWQSEEVVLPRIRQTFSDGSIDLNGTLESDGTTYTARGTFHSTVTLVARHSVVASHIVVDPPSIDVDVPHYLYEVTSVFGPLGLVVAGALTSAGRRFLERLDSMIALTSGSFDYIAVSAEGISLSRVIKIKEVLADKATIEISGSIVTTGSRESLAGTYGISKGCLRGAYPYKEYLQSQEGVFVAMPTCLSKPVTLQWALAWENGATFPLPFGMVLLTGSSGVVTLSGMECHFAAPLPQGTNVRQSVHVGFSILSDSVKLTNVPEEGTYALTLIVRATDSMGNVAVAAKRVMFFGEVIRLGGNYRDRLWQCLWGYYVKHAAQDSIQHIQPTFHATALESKRLSQLIRLLMRTNTVETDDLLAHVKPAMEDMYFETLFAPTRDVTANDLMAAFGSQKEGV